MGKEVSENNMLMNQRKNANHPFLFGEPTTPTGEFVGEANPKTLINASGKFRLLDRLLVKLKEGGQSTVIQSNDRAAQHHRGRRALEEVGRLPHRRRRRAVGAAAADRRLQRRGAVVEQSFYLPSVDAGGWSRH